ncbi:hypothetical protein LJB71_11665 [Thermomonas sp. S9]|nr:hypothetical protein [Thermomonas sp. S9]
MRIQHAEECAGERRAGERAHAPVAVQDEAFTGVRQQQVMPAQRAAAAGLQQHRVACRIEPVQCE